MIVVHINPTGVEKVFFLRRLRANGEPVPCCLAIGSEGA